MTRVRSVETASLPAGSIAASAASDYAAHPAAQPRGGRITATTVGRLSNRNTGLIASCVYSFCMCSVVYVILICDQHHTTGQLSPMLFVP